MARLDLRLEKPNLDGGDLRLGVVAHVRQVKDAGGDFPSDPTEYEVVIPAGVTETRTLTDLPLGTYRIDARLPSGQVLRKTRQLTPEKQAATAIFDAGGSPHEWLALQRLAGNVPSQTEYEAWVARLADQINDFAQAKLNADKPIEVDPATIGRLARLLRRTHLMLEPLLKSVSSRFGSLVTGGILAQVGGGADEPASGAPVASTAEPVAEFEIVRAVPLDGEAMWRAVASMADWRAWRAKATQDSTLAVTRVDDRQVTLWRIAQIDRDQRAPGPSGKPAPFRSFVATRRGEGVDVMPLPVPWPLTPAMPAAGLEILRESGSSDAGRTVLTVRDDFIGSLLLYLGNGRMSDAATVLAEVNRDSLIEALISDKLANPFAACAAAYVGIATLADNATPPPWTDWLDNLMMFFDWLPDGAIIRGAHLLKTAQTLPELETALTAFKTAFRRGIPFYTVGLQHLLNGLYMFSEQDAQAKSMHEQVSVVASRVDGSQAFAQIMIGVPVAR